VRLMRFDFSLQFDFILIKYMKISFLLILFSFSLNAQNYTDYHLKVYKAEELIFLENQIQAGLDSFERTFKEYDYLFIDDCVEAFQLALFFRKEDYAMRFIKRAMDNGLELNALKYLNQRCSCNFYQNRTDSIDIINKFVAKHLSELKKYEEVAFKKYILSLNKEWIIRLFKNHVIDELYKNYHAELNYGSAGKQKEVYEFVLKNNYFWVDSLMNKGIGLGDRNLGHYSEKMIFALGIENYDPEVIALNYMKKYKLQGKGRVIPILTYGDYFSSSALFISYYHDRIKFVSLLSKYKELMIGGGFIHPRELAYLSESLMAPNQKKDQSMCLDPINFEPCSNPKIVNERRRVYNVCSIELDIAKHKFAHQNHLQLLFGFFNATR